MCMGFGTGAVERLPLTRWCGRRGRTVRTVKTDAERDDLRKRLEDFGYYTDGDVRIEVIQPKG